MVKMKKSLFEAGLKTVAYASKPAVLTEILSTGLLKNW